MKNKTLDEQLIGRKCWRAWDGLLPAIFFELGEKRNSRVGEYSLCMDTCPWQIFKREHVLTNSRSEKGAIRKVLPLFINKKITNFEFDRSNSQVKVTFDDLKIIAYLNEETDTFYIINQEEGTVIFMKDGK